VPNFVEIARTMAEIWRFFYFPKWRPPPSWIFKLRIFNGGTGHECRIATPCQMSWRSAKLLPICRGFLDFSRWQPPPSWILKILNCSYRGRDMKIFRFLYLEILKFQIFNGRTRQECRTASPCQTSWQSARQLPRYCSFYIF